MSFVQVIPRENYAILQLDRGKSNPINHEFVRHLRAVLKEVLHNDDIQGSVINGKPGFFSVGLDLPELSQYNKEEFSGFWTDFMGLICDLLAFDKPLVASITGHAPAGGCILGIGCDYRVMAEGNYRIGLNEIPVGLVVPKGIFDIYAFWLGRRKAYQYLMEGKLYLPEHAQEIGLVDEVVEPGNVLATAENKLCHYLSFNQPGWRKTKQQLRRDLVHSMLSISKDDMQVFEEQWWSPAVRVMLEEFTARLKK